MIRDPRLANLAAAAVTLSGTQTLTNKTISGGVFTSGTINGGTINNPQILSPVLNETGERLSVVASAATGTINLDVKTASILYYTGIATANHTLNVRGDSSTPFAYNLGSDTGWTEAMTVVWMNTTGSPAYYPNVFQIDGCSITPKWQGGSAPTSGNTNSIDVYTYTIFQAKPKPLYVSALTSSGTTATLTAPLGHGFATGDLISIIGANPVGYNGTYSITVTSSTQFTYTLATTLTSPATANPIIVASNYRVLASQTKFA